MKKLILSISVGLLLLAGCSKENDSTQIEEQTGDLVWVYNLDGILLTQETPSINELQSNSGVIPKRGNGNSAHTHGDFPGVEFSGTENNGGAHGSATVSLGPFRFTLETECVMVEGNEAVYGGTITERVGPPPPPGAPFNVGDHIYFKVFDNGQGNNADPDQFYGSIKFSSDSQCGVYTPGNAGVWPPTIFFPPCGCTISLINDVPEPGSIKVNNF